jgi:uncharacterized surface protein with fasciclin (FAS1) repeats
MNIMRRIALSVELSCILFAGMIVSTCSKSNSTSNQPTKQTIGAQISSGSNFTLLAAAATKAGLINTLEGGGPYTLFAPTDSAFMASGITMATINSLSAGTLDTVLLYHMLISILTSSQLPAGPNAGLTTESGDSIFVTNSGNEVFVNGIKVLTVNIPASNGVIHTIGRVLIPSFGLNIVQKLTSDTSFSFLVAALARARARQEFISGTLLLSSAGPMTLFAPTNKAFRAAGFPDTAAINATNPTSLFDTLMYHVISPKVFSSDFTNGETLATNIGGTVTISLSGSGATIKGKNNTTASNIIATNMVATNGVIHVIDQVLLP